ncbi:putative disease resistance protein RGA4 [Setaria italica]|uniref:putative disease resistance protein RGA4 n=1 Tax=Setaria italica TaxID=4555 RepID=UPI000BE51695|nr:putative disease resistance protein RGA4 [Setaria italica]
MPGLGLIITLDGDGAQGDYRQDLEGIHIVLRRWCCVYDDFDGTIASNICQTSDKDHEKALKELQGIITGKRYLIVLDDVWNRDEAKWGKPMSCLKQGGKGSAVLTTTHDAEVAQIMKMGVAEAYTIEKLSPKHLMEIVQSRAFNLQKPNIEELDDIVDMIVDRFAGSPLAAKTLVSVLNTKTSLKEWKDISAKSITCLQMIAGSL